MDHLIAHSVPNVSVPVPVPGSFSRSTRRVNMEAIPRSASLLRCSEARRVKHAEAGLQCWRHRGANEPGLGACARMGCFLVPCPYLRLRVPLRWVAPASRTDGAGTVQGSQAPRGVARAAVRWARAGAGARKRDLLRRLLTQPPLVRSVGDLDTAEPRPPRRRAGRCAGEQVL